MKQSKSQHSKCDINFPDTTRQLAQQQATLFFFSCEGHKECLNMKWELCKVDNAQRSITMQSNILCEKVEKGLWGMSSQGIRSQTYNSLDSSLYIKRATEVAQRSSSKLGAQRRLCEELQSELMSADTHSHTVFFPGLSCTARQQHTSPPKLCVALLLNVCSGERVRTVGEVKAECSLSHLVHSSPQFEGLKVTKHP